MLLALIETTKHFALLLALLYLYGLLLPRITVSHNRKYVLALQSVLFSLVAVVSMTMSMTIAPGQYGDSRTIIVATAAATAGPVPGVISAVVATLVRSAYPLDGFMNGTVSVLVAAILGSVYFKFEQSGRVRGGVRETFLFGLVLALSKLAILLLFGADNREEMFSLILLPTLILFPAGFMLSFLLIRREKHLFDRALLSAEHRSQFEAAIQMGPVGILICRPDGRCVYANEMAAKALDTTVEALLDWPADPLVTVLADDIGLLQPISEGRTLPLMLPNGTEHWFLVSSRPVRYGSMDSYLITLQNITEQRENQRRLEFSEARFRRFAEASGEGVLIVSENGIIDANQKTADLFGYALNELVGLPLYRLFAARDRDGLADKLADNGNGPVAATGLRKDGQRFDTEMAVRKVQWHGAPVWLVTVRDLTERQALEAQRLALLVEQNKVRELHAFIRSTEHDLRTPLAVINTSLYLAQKAQDTVQLDAQLHKAEQQVAYLGGMLDRIHDWVHLNNAESLALMPTHLHELLFELEQQFMTQAAARQLSLHVNLAPELPVVNASLSELRIALQAVLRNALLYTPPGGYVTLRVYADSGEVCIDVEDTGTGINSAALPHIFEPFYKADPARSSDIGGVGLGLTIVERVVDLHNGTVKVESAPGVGTKVTIRLHANAELEVALA